MVTGTCSDGQISFAGLRWPSSVNYEGNKLSLVFLGILSPLSSLPALQELSDEFSGHTVSHMNTTITLSSTGHIP